jgi:hypothetical protein
MEAAIASRCAAEAGVFEPFNRLLFSRTGLVRGEFERSANFTPFSTASVGNEPWLAIAEEVGISDTLAFKECLEDSVTARLVALDTLAATRLGARGTPTFLFNHLLVHGFLRTEGLDEIFRTVLPVGLEGDGGRESVEHQGSLSPSP